MMMKRFSGMSGILVLAIASSAVAGDISYGPAGVDALSQHAAFDTDQQLMAMFAELELLTPAPGDASAEGAQGMMNFSMPAVPGWAGGWMGVMVLGPQPDGGADGGPITNIGGFSIEGDADMAASGAPPTGGEFGDPLPDLEFAGPDISPNPSPNNDLTATVPLPTPVYMAALGLLLVPVARRFWLGRIA